MTPRQFADLAAAVASHFEELSNAGGPDAASLHRVWKRASRCLMFWREELFSKATPSLYAEIFAAELPIRVWCTAVAASGRKAGECNAAAVAGKINAELLELRCLALQALAADHGLTNSEAAAMDRFRRRCERWCDALLGPIVGRTGVTEFAIRPDRATDFAEQFSADPSGSATWPLVTAGLRLTFAEADSFRGPDEGRSGTAAADLASAIFASFPAEAFSSGGLLRAAHVGRTARVPKETALKKVVRTPLAPNAASANVAATPKASQIPRPHQPISFVTLRKRGSKP
ncbi:MAG: hypothetical protein M3552_01450 [Planctomycetota bacterium]|nr:hypothetical protein [Planctomycetaceae bacterium]MDQ3329311.1 hypothetical protein [Planctomycetota bacterium]